MLQQILADMYIDPDVLEALNEEQKKILFFKMREEQVRRWKEREEKEGKEGIKKEKLQQKKGPCKSVSWLLGSDGDVHVCIIRESDELKSPKLILSELKNKAVANPNTFNRAKAEPVNSSLTKPSRAQQTSTESGIQLLLKKPEELSDSTTVSDESKQDSGSDQSADDYGPLVKNKDSGLTNGSRVAQLRKNFNTTNAPSVKPPIPCKPTHLLASPSVR
ncbi:SH2 domain-containing protein 4A-like [Sinocyclocheilus grahami]|uniref:SH2 domain-containing protein 4A-like n=1 Tax=Sinocyclocheilus grahami TaxID=75366 RepID=UPI0007AD16D2|nr:PREDICTED: SH2 domain-containing protein 4A-like [Sinocyclocheilus grahami]